jgi:hypothetical protein
VHHPLGDLGLMRHRSMNIAISAVLSGRFAALAYRTALKHFTGLLLSRWSASLRKLATTL